LGHGDQQDQLLPKEVEAFACRRVVATLLGGAHSIALTADGAVFTWGKGEHGCLGHGEDLSNPLLPKKIEALCALCLPSPRRDMRIRFFFWKGPGAEAAA